MRRVSSAKLPFDEPIVAVTGGLADALREFRWREAPTAEAAVNVPSGGGSTIRVPSFTNEFWTAKQRAAHSLHEVSYRACFKPQLPRFFIERLTQPGDVVYDPFMGRGTTLIEAALMDRVPYGCDVNPLSRVLCEPRLDPPSIEDVISALDAIDFNDAETAPTELEVFYHCETLRQISALRKHLLVRQEAGQLTAVDRWIRMVAVNRLTGHSPGFFSVYTMPPNQAVSAKSQAKINEKRKQVPPRRNVPAIILRKSRSLLHDVTPDTRAQLRQLGGRAQVLTRPSSETSAIPSNSVALVVTSPPFLDVVDYKTDNWLRCWFSGIEMSSVGVTLAKTVDAWRDFVIDTLRELRRVLEPGGHVAFEVGEVKRGTVQLEELVIPAGLAVGLEPVLVLVNAQRFTKTANCWGVTNNTKGTNTNRVVVFEKSE